ncbi:winged helix-turn-helix domain-containing protein [Neptunicella sp. SCSIO 80796]|uniref:winged helix-turn-helix domain-containing protein n=1 Tax=Neptunicella plasticusilytica TaxID=3117012 RepID=UPI003A4DC667
MFQQAPFCIGKIRIEPLEYAIYPDKGPKQSLQPKFIEVLCYLANQYPNVVSRQELIEHIWHGNIYVGEKALTNAIWHLRQALTQAEQPEIIETIRKSGYRLLVAPQMLKAVTPRFPRSAIQIMVITGMLLLSAILFSMTDLRSPSGTSSNEIQSITAEPGLELFPAPSPDGRYLVYKWRSPDGQVDLYRRDVTQPQLSAVRLTFDHANEGRAVWSRDGKWLYFRRKDIDENYCDIVKMDVQSLQEHFVAKCPMTGALHYMDISPDNTTLAYWGILEQDPRPGIFLLDLNDPAALPRPLPCDKDCDQSERDMAFSPDGQYIAITRRSSRFSEDIHLIHLASGRSQQLTFGKRDIVGLTWRPDGQSLIYAVQQADVRSGFELNLDTLESKPLNIKGFSYPSFARQLPWLFFQHRDEQYQIAAQSLDNEVSSSPFPILQSGYNHKYPDYSAVTDQIAYASNESGYYEIWLADANGSNRRQLTDLKRSVRFPKWSHDGQFVAFLAPDETGNADRIYIVNVLTRRTVPVLSPFSGHNRPTWVPDDSAIISAVYSEDNRDLYRFELDHQQVTRLTWDGGRYGILIDNDTLIYTRTTKGLFQKRPEQKKARKLLGSDTFRVRYTWVYTQDGIYFPQLKNDHQQIGFYSLSSQQFTPLLKLPLSSVVIDSSMSLDNRRQRLLFTKTLFYQSDIKLIKDPVFH